MKEILKKNKVPTRVSSFIHEATTNNQRKIIVFIGVEKKISNFKIVFMKKKIGNCWDSSTCLVLQNPVILPTVPWELMEFLAIVSEFTKMYSPIEIRIRTYRRKNFCPDLTAETI